MNVQSNIHTGSNFEDFLEQESLLQDCQAVAIKRVISWQLQEHMREARLSKTAVARELGTSRSFVDKLLAPDNTSITLASMLKVARLVGKPLRLEFGDSETPCAPRGA